LVKGFAGISNLDDYAQDTKKISFAKNQTHTHVTLDPKQENDHTLLLTEGSTKKSLAKAIVLAALLGDHDINPANMVVVPDKNNQMNIAKIDFGHAFNDLLNTSPTFGGQLQDAQNPVFDFFNREHVAGAKFGGDESKLWRNYSGLIPSEEMIEALIELGNKPIEQGINDAKLAFKAFRYQLREQGETSLEKHVVQSMLAIDRATNKGVQKESDPDKRIDAMFDNLTAFVNKNRENALKAANVMQLQLNVDNYLKHSGDINELKAQYASLEKQEGAVQWIKTDKKFPAFNGNLEGYIAFQNQRNPQLTVENTESNIITTKNYRQEMSEKRDENHRIEGSLVPYKTGE